MPNPDFSSPSQLEYYEFLGKLIGVALRTRTPVPLALPSLLWKALVRQPLSPISDVDDIDHMCIQSLARLETIDQDPGIVTEEEFREVIVQNFTTESVNPKIGTVCLVPGGQDSAVTMSNRLRYANLVRHFRLHECDLQIEAVRTGLSTIVTPRVLPLFTADEFQLLVCGLAEVDLEMLRRHTIYEGYTTKSPTIQDFWACLEEFTNEQRELFLKFIWGRSRLPLTDAGFDRSMKIQALERPVPDMYLPLSHTCFFSLELPRYSSQDVLRERLLYAITNCHAIDTDFVAAAAPAPTPVTAPNAASSNGLGISGGGLGAETSTGASAGDGGESGATGGGGGSPRNTGPIHATNSSPVWADTEEDGESDFF